VFVVVVLDELVEEAAGVLQSAEPVGRIMARPHWVEGLSVRLHELAGQLSGLVDRTRSA
jgi:hypothetical protein